MPESKPPPLSPKALEQAAQLLGAELLHFEQAAERAARLELTSFKALERAKEAVTDAIAARDRFGAALGKLVEAVTDARLRQEGSAQLLQDRAQEIERRVQEYREVYGRFATLGQEATAINALVAAAAAARGTPEGDAAAGARLREAVTRLLGVRDGAAALFAEAKEAQFTDLAHQADALRQQVGSAAEKLERMVPAPEAPPPAAG
jgi:hypothetical protein